MYVPSGGRVIGENRLVCFSKSAFGRRFVPSKKLDRMTYNVQIKVMPLKELLDPQGKAVLGGLQNLGLKSVEDVRIGKHITLQLEAASEAEAQKAAEEACKQLLANPVMEFYEIEFVQ